jgi:hypothetical protein
MRRTLQMLLVTTITIQQLLTRLAMDNTRQGTTLTIVHPHSVLMMSTVLQKCVCAPTLNLELRFDMFGNTIPKLNIIYGLRNDGLRLKTRSNARRRQSLTNALNLTRRRLLRFATPHFMHMLNGATSCRHESNLII